MKPFKSLMIVFIMLLSLPAFSQIYTNSVKSKYVKTTVDTFVVPGLTTIERTGFITNQSASKQLLVYFSFTNSGAKDTSTRVLIEPGKTLHFTAKCSKIYRNAVTDSAYSQIIIGDVQLNYNDSQPNENYEYAVYHFDNEFLKPERYKHTLFRRINSKS